MEVYLTFRQKSGSEVVQDLVTLQPRLLTFLCGCDLPPHCSGWQLELQPSHLHST